MTRRWRHAAMFCFLIIPAVSGAQEQPQITVIPHEVRLTNQSDRTQLLVEVASASQSISDVTRAAEYESLDPSVCRVGSRGVVVAVGNGHTAIRVRIGELTKDVAVHVDRPESAHDFHFENDIVPILSRYGCNHSGCHGKAEGQNGFKLSVFGFDPPGDFNALVKEGRGRRIDRAIPSRSLLISKASGSVPHGGGIRIPRGTVDYQTLLRWVESGAAYGAANPPRVTKLTVYPKERQLPMKGRQQIRVVATFSDGRDVDVTPHARFQSNNDALGQVDEAGFVAIGNAPGEVAVMASYLGAVDVFRALIPAAGDATAEVNSSAWPRNNWIDDLVHAKLRKLRIAPSGTTDDATYLRRLSLDVIGTLPTADEVREFLADTRPDRRAHLVTQLLQRPEYAEYWALKWSDLLRVDRLALGHQGAFSYYRWIREQFTNNRPMNELAAGVLLARGPLNESPAGQFYKAVGDPGDRAGLISQVFLGVRIECARCHHHPYDRWSQTDYLGMQAFFAQVGFKAGLDGEVIVTSPRPKTVHPRTQEEVFAHALATPVTEQPLEGDPRIALSSWLTARENPWFAKNMANRIWAHMLGRGLVEPVDDFRLTNPPSNPQLLDALADHLIQNNFDIHSLIRVIAASATYQCSTQPNASNFNDEQNYSRYPFKRMDAEVLLDAICQTTGVKEKFPGVSAGVRAIELWDSQVSHEFLKMFGRPVRATACTCERVAEPTVGQILHTLNSPMIQSKLSHAGGRIVKLVENTSDNDALAEELYLTFLGRFPSERETEVAADYLKSAANRRQATEDLAWAMLNTLEFLFNH